MKKIVIRADRFLTYLFIFPFLAYSIWWLGVLIKIILTGTSVNNHPIPINYTLFFSLLSLFFLLTSWNYLQKLLKNKDGVIIDENGITDYSSALSVGFIDWKDISGIRKIRIGSQSFVLIDVLDSQKYIDKENKIKGALLWFNKILFGTPLAVGSTLLKSNFSFLEDSIRSGFTESRNTTSRQQQARQDWS